MKRFLALLATGALVGLGLSTSAFAQTRAIGAGALVLDDNLGHKITVQTPQFGSQAWTNWQNGTPSFANYTWTAPIPPAAGAQGGFVYTGPLSGVAPMQLLYWIYPGVTDNTNTTPTPGGATGAWNYATPVQLGLLAASPALGLNVIPKSDGSGGLILSGFTDNATTISTSEAISGGAITAASNFNTIGGAYQIGTLTVLANPGTQNLFAGVGAGASNTGSDVTAIGYDALTSFNSGNNNTALGAQALGANLSGSNNTASGFRALVANTGGSDNTALGSRAGEGNVSGSLNTFVGEFAGSANISGGQNTALGYGANMLTPGILTNATAIGYGAIAAATNNIQLGNTSVTLVNTSGAYNTATVYQIGASTVLSIPGTNNIFAGVGAGVGNTGTDNAFFGNSAGALNTGNDNTFVGKLAGVNTTADYNSFFGFEAGYNNTSGVGNTISGAYAGYTGPISGNYNTFNGYGSGYNNAAGASNVFVGYYAGNNNTSGSNNTVIGSNADVSIAAATNRTAIGSGAIATADNTMQLGNVAVTLVNTSGVIASTGLTLLGGSSPITLNGAVGASGDVLTSTAGGTPTWTTPLSSATAVEYNVAAPQATATPGTNDLFNVAYLANSAATPGAVINSTTGGTVSATGLTVTAQAADGVVTGLIADGTGGTSATDVNIGVLGASNRTSGQITTFEGTLTAGNYYTPAGLPFGAGIVGYNPNDGSNQYAGYFEGTNTNPDAFAVSSGVLRAINSVPTATNLPNGAQPSAAFFTFNDNGNAQVNQGPGNAAAPVALNAGTTTTSDNSQAMGGILWGTTSARGSIGTQAVGAFGLAETKFLGGAASHAKIVGVSGGATATQGATTYSLIGVQGVSDMYSNNFTPLNIGGYFVGQRSPSTNLGVVGRVNGSTDNLLDLKDATGIAGALAGKNIAVVGMNYNVPDGTNWAGYFGGALNLGGTASPLYLNGAGGAAGQVLTSAGPSLTPTWTTALTSSSGVAYNILPASAQITATPGTNDLFNVAYAPNADATAGAVINSTTTGTVSATGLTVTAQAADGIVTGLIADGTGGASTSSVNIGVLGAPNRTVAQIAAFEATLPAGYAMPTLPFGAGIVGYNPNDGDNQYAGFFSGTNTNKDGAIASGVLRAINSVTTDLPDAVQPSAGYFTFDDNGNGKAYDGNPAVPVAIDAGTTTTSDNSQAIGGILWATTWAQGSIGTQAVGAFGLAETKSTAFTAAHPKIVGVEGAATATVGASNYSLIGVLGVSESNATKFNTPLNMGGYFIGQNATSTNLGVVGRVNGSTAALLDDGTLGSGQLTGKNIAVLGVNPGGGTNDYAGFFEGNIAQAAAANTISNVGADAPVNIDDALQLGYVASGGTGAESIPTNVTVFEVRDDGNVTGVAVTLPVTGVTNGRILYIHNADAQATTGTGGGIPTGQTWTMVYSGGAWQHAN